MATPKATEELKQTMKDGMALLETIRDELRVKAHLAGMDAKDRLHELEQKLVVLQRAGHDANLASKHALDELVVAFKELRKTLKAQLRN